ncbi:hypothetical protein [Geobacter sp. SVR]|uniref:hypothetical protein n=1 Tax=Geobacter sp. SVR TaxID=2495594 RepID=UPI00143F01C6|nr:hypothetical protein [Geobacter sp. SVR]BCS53547.1 hypothetical protein GSVR_18550 [Geobacter sp. SVR]GCF84256.1 hypothetical protein GSbR_08560 [Geobacter sp. SVR]
MATHKLNLPDQPEQNCDVSIWCEECQQGEYTTSEDKYLCAACGKILGMNHEVRHEIFPHVAGDYRELY